MSVTVSPDRLADELNELRRQRTAQQATTRSLRVQLAEGTDGAGVALAQSVNRVDELSDRIRELEEHKAAQLAAVSNGHGVSADHGNGTGLKTA